MPNPRPALLALVVLAIPARASAQATQPSTPAPAAAPAAPAPTSVPARAVATFAGGCFWCMEGPFDAVAGVLSTTSGYTGGKEKNPTYEQVSSHGTGHAEAIQVVYDPSRVTYEKLLEVFWHNIDPTTRDRQFCDAGRQYRSAIFVHGPDQRRLAEASKKQLDATKPFQKPIVTEIVDAGEFWPAEDYHQDFYKKSPGRYQSYRQGCGRDDRLKELWGAKAGH